MQALADAAVARFGGVNVFCNNAGVGGGGLSWEMPLSTWEWVLGVNLWGVIHGIRAFVPLLMQQDEAHIVNTASIAGLVAAPFMGPYNASKHAVVALSETLHHELAMMAPHVKASVLCPGWVNTNIADSSRNRPAHLQGDALEDGIGDGAELLRQVIAQGMPPAKLADKVARRDPREPLLDPDPRRRERHVGAGGQSPHRIARRPRQPRVQSRRTCPTRFVASPACCAPSSTTSRTRCCPSAAPDAALAARRCARAARARCRSRRESRRRPASNGGARASSTQGLHASSSPAASTATNARRCAGSFRRSRVR